MSRRRLTWVLATALMLSACASARPGRFKDQPIVWRVDDEREIAQPGKRIFDRFSYFANGFALKRIRNAIDPPRSGPARDTNALDEVPDSSWFINRTLTPAQVAKGPDGNGPPQPPLTVTSAKTLGDSPGAFVKDSRGRRYLIKFDTLENPEQQTGTDAIVNRIFWALGYFAPLDSVFFMRRTDLHIAAKLKGTLTQRDLDVMLRSATRRRDGAIRALASEFVPGKPLGGWATTGRGKQDPNDRIAHEHRRVLRGLRVLSAWLGHTDVKPDNTMDVFIGKNGRGFLRHYLIDFGEAFGGHQSGKGQLEVGWEYGWDWLNQGKALVSFGLWTRKWERQRMTPYKSVGYFSAAQFDPLTWRERYPYEPFFYADRNDNYWAAKLVMRFNRALLAAAVATGKLSEPGAARYLVDTLLARREKIGRAYFGKVTPFDRLRINNRQLCGTDLARFYGLQTTGVIEIVSGGPAQVYTTSPKGEGCVPLVSDGNYRIIRLRIRRGKRATPVMQVHYKGSRLLGVVR